MSKGELQTNFQYLREAVAELYLGIKQKTRDDVIMGR
jgi:hypothetical protein